MRGGRLAVFVLGLVAALAGSAWWLLSVPYQPHRLLHAVPAEAVHVSVHRDVAGRWEAFSGNPVTRSLLLSLGLLPEDLDALGRDPARRAWLERLVSDHLVVARLPARGPAGRPGWVFASWLGGRSQRLRWLLSIRGLAGLHRVGAYRGRPVWRIDGTGAGPMVLLAFVEGMVVGCLSDTADGIRLVLDTYDGLLPSRGRAGVPVWEAAAPFADRPPDWGWFRPDEESGSWTYGLSRLETNRLEGAVSAPPSFAASPSTLDAVRFAELQRLAGPAPMAVLAGTAAGLAGTLPRGGETPAWTEVLRHELEEAGDLPAAVLLLGGPYEGKLAGVTLPAVVGAFRIRDPQLAFERAGRLLDALNRRYRLGLIPSVIDLGEAPARSIESTGEADGAWAELAALDRPAFAHLDGWLVAASSLRALRRLVVVGSTRGGEPGWGGEDAGAWLRDVQARPAELFAWVDLDQGGKMLRTAAAMYAYRLLAMRGEDSYAARQRIQEVRAWADALVPMGKLRIWKAADGDRVGYRVAAGPFTEAP